MQPRAQGPALQAQREVRGRDEKPRTRKCGLHSACTEQRAGAAEVVAFPNPKVSEPPRRVGGHARSPFLPHGVFLIKGVKSQLRLQQQW